LSQFNHALHGVLSRREERKVLRPNHFPDRAALEKRLLAVIEHYNDPAESIQWSYTVEQLIEKFGTD
jgi:hypothetical protein